MKFNEHKKYGITCFGIGDILCSLNALENMAIERDEKLDLYVLNDDFKNRFMVLYENLNINNLNIKYEKDTKEHIEFFSAFPMYNSYIYDWPQCWGLKSRIGQEYMIKFKNRNTTIKNKIGVSFTITSNPSKNPSVEYICNIIDKIKIDTDIHYYGFRNDKTDKWILDKYKSRIIFDDYDLNNTISSISECERFIGSDSGMSWIASFFGIPTNIILSSLFNENNHKVFNHINSCVCTYENVPRRLYNNMTTYEINIPEQRCFNTSIETINDDKYLCCSRIDESRICMYFLNKHYELIGDLYYPNLSGITDPKIIKINNNDFLLSYSYNGYGDNNEYIEFIEFNVDLDLNIKFNYASKNRQLTIFGFPNYIKKREKSWSPFVVNNILYYIYNKNNHHHIIWYDNEIKCVRYEEKLLHNISHNKYFLNKQINSNGNCCLISDDLFITSFHINNNHDRYVVGYYLFSSAYPFVFSHMCDDVLIDSETYVNDGLMRGPYVGEHQKCCFVGSWCRCLADNNKILLSLGVNDYYNHIIEIEKKYLLDNAVLDNAVLDNATSQQLDSQQVNPVISSILSNENYVDLESLELGAGKSPNTKFRYHHDKYKHSKYIDFAFDLDVIPWPLPKNKFDIVYSNQTMEHLKLDINLWMDEMWDILKIGGCIYVQVPSYKEPDFWVDPTHRRWFDIRTFDYFDRTTELGIKYGSIYFNSNKWWKKIKSIQHHTDYIFILQKIN